MSALLLKEVKIFLEVLVFLEPSAGAVGPKTSCLGVKEVERVAV